MEDKSDELRASAVGEHVSSRARGDKLDSSQRHDDEIKGHGVNEGGSQDLRVGVRYDTRPACPLRSEKNS